MAKKIIIAFSGQPVVGLAIEYTIFINGVYIVYANGEATVYEAYTANGTGNNPPTFIELKTNLSDTIDNTLNFLIANFVYQNIYYRRVNNTIEVTIDTDELIQVSFGESGENIGLSLVDISADDAINLRYFFQYTNIVNDTFLCQIFKRNNLNDAIEIQGKAILEKGSVKDHLDPIRGTGLTLELEATNLLSLEDLYTENEQDFTVKFFKNGKLIFRGYLKPDGVFQSFTRDMWIISLDCVDGLGALENLSFVQTNGVNIVGKQSAINIIYQCLKRSGILLPINTSINTLYDGLTYSDNLDVLTKIYVNADRFYKTDGQNAKDGTIMSCEDVLKSILDVFCAVITQENGEWYIYKPNVLFDNPYILFRRYNIENTYVGNVTLNYAQILGSQIDNYYPHHCNGNQRLEIKGSIAAFRLGYKYGFVAGIFINGDLLHDGNLNYEGWNVNTPFLINDPLNFSKLSFKPETLGTAPSFRVMATSENVPVLQGDLFNFKANVQYNGFGNASFIVKVGNYYLTNQGEWVTGGARIIISTITSQVAVSFPISINVEIQSLPVIESGNAYIEIESVKVSSPNENTANLISVTNVNLSPVRNENDGNVGEFHTVTRATKVSTIVKENRTVNNGDSPGVIYLGAIFKEDQITPTETWFRNGKFESAAILRIAAEEELRINQKPLKIFRGSVFGFIPYLSLIEINNIQGKFSPIEYNYDTQSNITTFKLLELFSAEVSDIIYKFTLDFGTTVKPTIIS